MQRRSGLEIKKQIIKLLKGEPLSLRALESKLDTNYITIRIHCNELKYLGIVKFDKKTNEQNNRPSTIVKLTPYGMKL